MTTLVCTEIRFGQFSILIMKSDSAVVKSMVLERPFIIVLTKPGHLDPVRTLIPQFSPLHMRLSTVFPYAYHTSRPYHIPCLLFPKYFVKSISQLTAAHFVGGHILGN
jgi:hypothetical protein